MKSLFCAVVFSLTLAACAGMTPTPVMDTQTVPVEKQVPIACVKASDIPTAPAFLSDADLLSGAGSQVADKLWIDHKERSDYIGSLLAVLQGCETLPAQPAAFK